MPSGKSSASLPEACSSGRDRRCPTTLSCACRRGVSVCCYLLLRHSARPVKPMTGNGSMSPVPAIHVPNGFFRPPFRIDLKRSENDVGVAFCHYCDARDLCWHRPVANLHLQTL